MSKRYAVVGNPVGHSLSPQIHEAFAAQCGIALTYDRLLLEVADFAAGVDDFFRRGGCGLNVTLPFKQQAKSWVGRVDSLAQAAQAVNTIAPTNAAGTVGSGADCTGYNTDGLGLVRDLANNLKLSLRASRVLLLGAGGAAQGVLRPLLAEQPAQLVVANRTQIKAANLVAQVAPADVALTTELSARELNDLPHAFDLVINATSASVSGVGSIVAAQVLSGAFCYDMMYGPSTTFCDFARQSAAAGGADGLGMLVEQAAAAFEIWHGPQPNLDARVVLQDFRAQGLGVAPWDSRVG